MDPLDRFLRQLSPQRTQALLRVTSSTREGLEQALDGQKKRQRPGDGHFRPPRSRERYGATKQIRRSKIQHPHSKEKMIDSFELHIFDRIFLYLGLILFLDVFWWK